MSDHTIVIIWVVKIVSSKYITRTRRLGKKGKYQKSLVTGTSLMVQWLKFQAPNAGGMGLIPGQGTKIPHAARHGKKIKSLVVMEKNQRNRETRGEVTRSNGSEHRTQTNSLRFCTQDNGECVRRWAWKAKNGEKSLNARKSLEEIKM